VFLYLCHCLHLLNGRNISTKTKKRELAWLHQNNTARESSSWCAKSQLIWKDIASCEHLCASHRHFDIPDCIYRRIEPSATDPDSTNFLYPNEETIFGPIHPADHPLIHALSRDLKTLFPPKCEVVSPLTIGNHVDHVVVRAALEDTDHRLWYYADYPYVLEHIHDLEMWEMSGLERNLFQISPQGLTAWQASIAAHQSQISTFWSSQSAMETAIKTYSRQLDGIVLWKSL